jgi:hypothetical protein
MLKDCSCGGLNENCYRCFGRGYYDAKDILPDSLPKFSFKSNNKKSTISNKKWSTAKHFLPKKLINCPYCNINVNENRLNKHIQKVHGPKRIEHVATSLHQYKKQDNDDKTINHTYDRKWDTAKIISIGQTHSLNGNKSCKQNNAISTCKIVLIRCPYCGFNVREDILDIHISNFHKQVAKSVQDKPQIINQNNSSTTLTKMKLMGKCPYCNAIIDKTKLTGHINVVHKHRPKRKVKIYSCKHCNFSGPEDRLREHNNNVHKNKSEKKLIKKIKEKTTIIAANNTKYNPGNDKLDGSKGFYHAREDGKYGSLSSYDPYDDESFP